MATEKVEAFAARILERTEKWEQGADTREKYRQALKRAALLEQNGAKSTTLHFIGTKPYEAAMPKKSMAQQMAELLVQDRDAGLTALTEKSGYRVDELKRIWQEWLDTEYGEKPVAELALDFAAIVMEHDL